MSHPEKAAFNQPSFGDMLQDVADGKAVGWTVVGLTPEGNTTVSYRFKRLEAPREVPMMAKMATSSDIFMPLDALEAAEMIEDLKSTPTGILKLLDAVPFDVYKAIEADEEN